MQAAEARSAAAGNPYAWTDLGAWNAYFLAKLALAWTGALNLQVLPNLLFAAALLVPLPRRGLRRLRTAVAVPVAAALLYQDTWLPPFSRLLAQPGVLNFSPAYLVELLGRFIDWETVGLIALVALGYLLLRSWVRLTTFSLAGLLAVSLAQLPWPAAWRAVEPVAAVPAVGESAAAAPQGPADTATLDAYVEDFYARERGRRTDFPAPQPQAEPFDLIVLNICSLAWSDLEEAGLRDNPLFARMDAIFDRFNSATAYSGPAAIRLLRASCGQPSHARLYEPSPAQCYLFQNLEALGFGKSLAMNHDGHFDRFLEEVRDDGRLAVEPLDIAGLPRALVGFDGSPIRRDRDVLDHWLRQRQSLGQDRVALFYNTITLHDGNRLVTAEGRSRAADFRTRAAMLLEDFDGFIRALERSGRRAMVVVVPEHGAALRGDRMQISGMREIPSPAITEVPVGVKLIGMGASPEAPARVAEPSSYLALSELVARVYAASAQPGSGYDRSALLADLPRTEPVSENSAARVVDYGGRSYVQVEGGPWMPYPKDRR